MYRRAGVAWAFISIVLVGCAAVEPIRGEDCAQWFATLDATVDHAGVRDAGVYRTPGYPYFRLDRFLASFRKEILQNPPAFEAWVKRLRALDARARSCELQNLPPPLLRSLNIPDGRAAAAKVEVCAAELGRADLQSKSGREALAARAAVPDEYSDLNRVLGLYPLATLPFSIGIDHWQAQTVDGFRRAAAGETAAGPIARYELPGRPLTARGLTAIFARSNPDPLGIPRFSRDDREQLFETFAPVFEIVTSGDFDRFGPLAWGAQPAPEVNVSHPTVYRRLAFTRYDRHVLTQLVYTVWFPERPRERSLDLVSGRLDGLVFRVTLDPQGHPLVYDTIHPCGCYHMFFPTARVRVKPSPQPGLEWAFVPATLPSVDPTWRIVWKSRAALTTSRVCALTRAAAALSIVSPKMTNCVPCRASATQPAAPSDPTGSCQAPNAASGCCSGRQA
ncbi:MAG: hypothetical protein WA633_24860 [Stellaceae bacterium]